jgi:hypothetical protein
VLGLAAGGGALAAGTALAGCRAVGAGAPAYQRLLGTWTGEFQARDAPPDRPPARLVFTFTEGGVIGQIGPGSRANGVVAFLSIGLGAWARTGEREFAFSYAYRRFLDDFQRTIDATTWVGLRLSEQGDEWSGTWSAATSTPTGRSS